jgi:hypothetical protein
MNINKNFKQFIVKLLDLKNGNTLNKHQKKSNINKEKVGKNNIQNGSNEESKEEEFDLGA